MKNFTPISQEVLHLKFMGWKLSKKHYFSKWQVVSQLRLMIISKLEDKLMLHYLEIQESQNLSFSSIFHISHQGQFIQQEKVVLELVLPLLLLLIQQQINFLWRLELQFWQIWVFAALISLIKWRKQTEQLFMK